MHFVITTGPDVDNNAREGYATFDAENPDTGYRYIATNNPNMGWSEHDYTTTRTRSSKIDLGRERDGQPNPDFGDVVVP